MSLTQTPLIAAATWRNTSRICAYADGERHLGHAVRAAKGWLAFDATHASPSGNTFLSLGYFPSVLAARHAVQSAISAGGDPNK